MKKWIKECTICQVAKSSNSKRHILVRPSSMSTVWYELTMNFIINLSQSTRKTIIIVVVDRLSKGGHFIMNLPLPRSSAYHSQTNSQSKVVTDVSQWIANMTG